MMPMRKRLSSRPSSGFTKIAVSYIILIDLNKDAISIKNVWKLGNLALPW